METETCTHCLQHILYDLFDGLWVHMATDEVTCDADDSVGTVAEPRR